MRQVLSGALKSRAALQLENIALRHQIGVLQRSSKKRLGLNNSDRLFWIGLSQVWSEWRSGLVIVKPDTVLAWHRKAFRTFWTWKVRRGKPGRPAVSEEVRALIHRMSRENPGWGAPRIHGELLKLGIDRRDEREQVPGPPAKATLTDLAHVLAESSAMPRFRRFLHRAHHSFSGPVCVSGASA
jgi:hypothetical protein